MRVAQFCDVQLGSGLVVTRPLGPRSFGEGRLAPQEFGNFGSLRGNPPFPVDLLELGSRPDFCCVSARKQRQKILFCGEFLDVYSLLRPVFWHSIVLAFLVGVIVMFYSYAPWATPSP